MRQLCREACEISIGARGTEELGAVEEADERGERPDGDGGVEVGGLFLSHEYISRGFRECLKGRETHRHIFAIICQRNSAI